MTSLVQDFKSGVSLNANSATRGVSDSIAATLPRSFNVAAALLQRNRERAAARALICGDRSFTHGQLAEAVARFAARLLAAGVRQEDRVALLLPDGPELVIGILAAIWMGAVAVPINTAYSSETIEFILEESRARALLIDEPGSARLSASLDSRLSIFGPAEVLAEHQIPMASPAATYRDEPCLWLYTSGSTGRPKAVMHAHGSLPAAAELYARRTLGLGSDDIIYSVAKLPFAYGLGASLYFPLWVGASVVLSNATQAFDYVADIHRYRPTVLFGIPSTYESLLAVHELAPLDASSLRLCVAAAEPLPERTFERFRKRHGLAICEGFGTSEMLHIFISNSPDAPRAGWAGKPVTGYRLRVLGDNGREAADGQPGLLEVEGETLMLGYFNRLEQSRRAIRHGAMLTGDRCVRDQHGYFKYLGRVDDLFKVNGQWVTPNEIESVLHEHPAVSACAVLRDSDDETAGVAAYVALRDGYEASHQLVLEIRSAARAKLPGFMAPRRIEFVQHMPRTATGKIDRGALQRLSKASEVFNG
ncbi:MAG TPA: benzoate-CoA ligase family protein [Polyangiaceae bacterium]|nr:benzoate-CoA ligase family protein [Polyangiaceae bacterium]